MSRATPFLPSLLDASKLDVLNDPAFVAAANRAAPFTILDLPRLANLWTLSRMTNPGGAIIEVGAYRGGSARLLCDANPGRTVFVCDTFDGFQDLPMDGAKDAAFRRDQFDGVSIDQVKALFTDRPDALLLQGRFPASDRQGEVRGLSFAHLDVDLYDSMRASLDYLGERFRPQSLIVIDDHRRSAAGVDQAIAEFLERHPAWAAFPMFPGQALLIHGSWFS